MQRTAQEHRRAANVKGQNSRCVWRASARGAGHLLEACKHEGWSMGAMRKQRVIEVQGMCNEVATSCRGFVLHACLSRSLPRFLPASFCPGPSGCGQGDHVIVQRQRGSGSAAAAAHFGLDCCICETTPSVTRHFLENYPQSRATHFLWLRRTFY